MASVVEEKRKPTLPPTAAPASPGAATSTKMTTALPQTVTTTTMTALHPISPIAVSKFCTTNDNDDTQSVSTQSVSGSPNTIDETTMKTSPSIPVVVDDSSSNASVGHNSVSTSTTTVSGNNSEKNISASDKTSESTMPPLPPPTMVKHRAFSPETHGLETLILAATDSMRDDDSTANSTLHSNEDNDARSVSSSSSGGRKLRTWQESFQALVSYKARHGNTNVPVRYPEDSALANWVRYQQRNQDSLPPEKRQQLKSIGFQFGARNDRQWDAKLQRLQEYQQEYGRHATVRDLELSQWVSTQRSLFKKNLLRADRKDKLDSIGFVWQANQKHVDSQAVKSGPSQSRRDAQWKAQFEKLQEFHRDNGHFRVPNQYEKDPSLGIWVSNQRSIHNRGQLPENRKALLDSIGFVWRVEAKDARASLYQKQWEQQLEGLLQYKLLHGNCDVPANFEKRGLGVWVVVQKEAGRKGSLDPVRAQKLLSTGLSWGDERDSCWTKNFVKLQGYLVGKKVGTEVTFEEISSFDTKLGNWIKLQCVVKKHEKLYIKRVFLLENIGCQWNDAKMIVKSEATLPPTVEKPEKKVDVPFVPDLPPSAVLPTKQAKPAQPTPNPTQAVKRTVSLSSSRAPTLAVKRPASPAVRKNNTSAARSPPSNPPKSNTTGRSSIVISPISVGAKRRVSDTIYIRPGRGRDPPGDPPGKRVRLSDDLIPETVRSDPPGDAPSSFIL